MSLVFPSTTNFDLKHSAFDYQKEAVDAIKDLEYAAIFHEQGLGKTKIAIDLMDYWFQNRNIDTVLIVTKKQLVNNWKNEFKEHTFIKPATIDNSKNGNYYVFNSAQRVVITNFETIYGEEKRISLWLKTRNVAIVIDESTKLKNPDSKLTQSFFKIAHLFKIRVIMTGTPIANRPYDMWSQIYFLDFGKSLGNDFDEFKKATDLKNDLSSNDVKREVFEECVSGIFKKIKDFTVRETKNSGIIKLPNKNYISILCHFEESQQEMYIKAKNQLELLMQKDEKAFVDDESVSLKRLLRLIQITSNPRLVNELYSCDSGKEIELDKIIKAIIKRGEMVIVWSSFIENIEYFAKKYKSLGVSKVHGSMPIEIRNKEIDKFKSKESKILFATPQAAKEGLTLTVANNVVFYDRGFNLDDYLQAQDRIHRISQTKECDIYNLIMINSVDIWIDKLLKAKQEAAWLGQGDINVNQFRKTIDYSYGDIIKEILNAEDGK